MYWIWNMRMPGRWRWGSQRIRAEEPVSSAATTRRSPAVARDSLPPARAMSEGPGPASPSPSPSPRGTGKGKTATCTRAAASPAALEATQVKAPWSPKVATRSSKEPSAPTARREPFCTSLPSGPSQCSAGGGSPAAAQPKRKGCPSKTAAGSAAAPAMAGARHANSSSGTAQSRRPASGGGEAQLSRRPGRASRRSHSSSQLQCKGLPPAAKLGPGGPGTGGNARKRLAVKSNRANRGKRATAPAGTRSSRLWSRVRVAKLAMPATASHGRAGKLLWERSKSSTVAAKAAKAAGSMAASWLLARMR